MVLGGPGCEVGQLVGRAREDAVSGRAAELVVGLVGSVSGVTEGGDSDDLLADLRVNIKVRGGLSGATLEESSGTTAENVANNLGTLRVTADDQLSVGASGIVAGELGNAVGNTLLYGCTERRFNGVVEKDVLVVAVVKTIANGVYELALTSGVGLVVALSKEDVNVTAGRLASLELRNGSSDRSLRKGKSQRRSGDTHICCGCDWLVERVWSAGSK